MDKNKSQNWNYAFDAMPILFHSQTNNFMKYLDKDGLKFLQFWWNHVGDKLPEEKRISPNGLTFEIDEIDKNTRMVIITLPSPKEDGDVYFLGCIARPEKRFAMVRLPTSRMFVLFRDDHVDQPHRTNFGELTPQARCRPRGIGLNPTKQDFKRIVKQKITAQKKGLFK
jgi:hypothetical protein